MKKIFFFTTLFLLLSCKKNDSIKPSSNKYEKWIGIYTYTVTYNKADLNYKYYPNYWLIVNKDSNVIFYDDVHHCEYSGKIINDELGVLNIELDVQGRKEKIQLTQDLNGGFHIPYEISNDSFIWEIYVKALNLGVDYDFIHKKLPITELYKFKIEDTGTVNSKNGLVVRNKPNLNSNKITAIAYGKELNILASTKKYDSITLSSNKKVIGEWKHIFYRNEKEEIVDGYVFDKFITYNIEKSSPNTKKVVNIYNEDQFFANFKSNTILNIKSKKLNFAKYIENNKMLRILEENAYDMGFREIQFSNGKYDNDYQTENHHYVRDVGVKKIFLHDVRNIEIISEHNTEITTYPLILKHIYNTSFNNVYFNILGKTNNNDEFRVYKSSNISFNNIDFLNQGLSIEEKSQKISFKYCSFDKKSTVKIQNSRAVFEKCKFNGTENQIILFPDIGNYVSKLNLSNSYIRKKAISIQARQFAPYEFIEENNTYR